MSTPRPARPAAVTAAAILSFVAGLAVPSVAPLTASAVFAAAAFLTAGGGLFAGRPHGRFLAAAAAAVVLMLLPRALTAGVATLSPGVRVLFSFQCVALAAAAVIFWVVVRPAFGPWFAPEETAERPTPPAVGFAAALAVGLGVSRAAFLFEPFWSKLALVFFAGFGLLWAAGGVGLMRGVRAGWLLLLAFAINGVQSGLKAAFGTAADPSASVAEVDSLLVWPLEMAAFVGLLCRPSVRRHCGRPPVPTPAELATVATMIAGLIAFRSDFVRDLF